jgi:hypothetical protein
MSVSSLDAASARASAAKIDPRPGLDALAAQSAARDKLREEADKRELRLALHDLAEGLRGMIRVHPLASVVGGVGLGLLLARRRKRRA